MKNIENPANQSAIPYPENYKDALLLCKSDYYRYFGGDVKQISLCKLIEGAYRNHCLGFMFWHRLVQIKGWLNPIARRMLKHYRKQYGLQIPPKTKIGWGLYIAHGINIVINETAVIGNNCNISHGLTIGSNEGQAASIGDCVYVGPTVCIVDDVKIGSHSTIGAGAVVVKDVEEDVTVAGVPAKIIFNEGKKQYILNKWSF